MTKLLAASLAMGVAGGFAGCGSVDAGNAPADMKIDVAFGLARNQDGLFDYARQVSALKPTAPPLNTVEIAQRFGASEQSAAYVVDYLAARGMTGAPDAIRSSVSADMTVQQARDLFNVGFNVEDHDGISVLLPTGQPAIPSDLADHITEVVGLAQSFNPQPPVSASRPSLDANAAECKRVQGQVRVLETRLGLGGPTLPRNGAGAQTNLTVAAAERFHFDDVAGIGAWAKCLDSEIPTGTVTSPYATDANRVLTTTAEVQLDVQLAMALLPALKEMTIAEFDPYDWTGEVFVDILGQAAVGKKPSIVTTSLGYCERLVSEGELALTEFSLAALTVVGTPVLAAAGDKGTSECEPSGDRGQFTQYPASSQWVTGVGGSQTGNGRSEVVWNDGDDAGGGGPSQLVDRPAFQAEVVQNDQRATPDVSLVAEPSEIPDVYLCNSQAQCGWQDLGGTSASAPLLAAGLARVCEAQLKANTPCPANWNAPLYDAAGKGGHQSPVVDIVSGTNDLFGVGCCTAVPGYDQASGLGAPKLARILDYLRAPISP